MAISQLFAALAARLSQRPVVLISDLTRRSFNSVPYLRGVAKDRLENLAPDRIHLKGLSFFAFHGVLPEENKLGQKFEVDATLYCDLQSAGRHDELDATTNYAEVYSQIKGVMEGSYSLLIEKVAEDVAATILQHNPLVAGVSVAVRKPHVALPGNLDFMGVEIRRVRSP